MSKLQALLTFLKLVVVLLIITLILHTGLRLYGLSTPYSRLDHDVLKNISSIIYLDGIPGDFVGFSVDQDLPEGLQKTQFFNLNSTEHEALNLDPSKDCFFVFINFDSTRTSVYKNILKPLETKDCVFIQSHYADVYTYFKKQKPRWFYGARHSDFLQFIFLNSIGLETVAPLKADFVIIDQSLMKQISTRLSNELKRRELVLFSLK